MTPRFLSCMTVGVMRFRENGQKRRHRFGAEVSLALELRVRW